MTYKQIEAARELRLWLTQVALPVGVTVACVFANDDLRRGVARKAQGACELFVAKILHK